MDTLDEALNSAEIKTVLISLGLDTSILNNTSDGTDALIKALEAWAAKSKDSKKWTIIILFKNFTCNEFLI